MTELTHHSFIRSRLPAWLLDANPTEQAKLQQAALSLAKAGHRFNQAMRVIPSMRDFALSRLQPAMNRLFGAQIDLEHSNLIRHFQDDCVVYPNPLGPSAPDCTPHPSDKRSLLAQALRNFTSADTQAQAFVSGSRFELYPDSAGASSPQLHDFARLCRELDIGTAYKRQLQRHLPEPPRDTADSLPPLAADYIGYRRALLRHDAQQARMQGRLDAEGERILAAFDVQLDASSFVTPLPAAVATGLEVSDRWRTERKVILQGVRVFWADRQTAQRVVPIVVHIPGDPVSPLKQYASAADFQDELSKRLKDLRYIAFFISLLPLSDRDWGDRTLVRLLRKGEQNLVTTSELRGGVWQGLYIELRAAALTNASTVARPVADIDRDVLLNEIGMWLRVGVQLFNTFIMFLPGVEPLVLTGAFLGMGQFILDVYEGIHDLNLGEKLEAIQHLFSAALSVVTVVAGGFVANQLVGEMAPVTTADGGERLWHGRTEGFAATRLPPADVTPDVYGVWRAADNAWVKIEGRFYEVVGEEHNLRIKLPPGARGVEPALEWSRPRGWRWAHRDPLSMQGARLLQEIDPQLQVLRNASLNDAQRLTGISDEQLRYLAVNGEPLPGQLPYMARRLEARAQVRDAVTHLRAHQPLQTVPRGVAQLLTELPGWPAQRAFRYTGEGGPFVLTGTGTELRLEESAFGTGQWQERLLAQLNSNEKRALLGDETPWEAPAVTRQRLTNLLADSLEANGYRLVDSFANLPAQHPNAAILRRDFPTLPGPVADALLAKVTAEEQRALIAGRVSASLAMRAVEALRELRVARALEALQAGVAGNDRDRLAMSLLAPELQSLAEPVRVQLVLDEGFVGGPLEVGEAGPLKVVRRTDSRYEPFDETDNELSPPTSLEDALLRALPDSARSALGLDTWEQDVLRSRLLKSALENRKQVRSALGMRSSQTPRVRLPEQVGVHLGYPMSGRGWAFWRRNTPELRLQELYPDQGISARILTELRGRSTTTGKNLGQLVSEKEAEWKVLDDSLATWEQAPNKHHALEDDDQLVRTAARQTVGEALRKSWRREMTTTLDERRVPCLALDSARVVELPSITADFSHIEALSLHDMALSGDPSNFLLRFPNLRVLWLDNNRLTRCPAALAEMPRLRQLNLAHNPLIFDDEVFAALLGPQPSAELKSLDLSGVVSATENAEDQSGAAGARSIEALASLPRLQNLEWTDNPLFRPEQLQAIGRLNRLEYLDLTDCRLHLDEQSGAFLTELPSLKQLVLSGNVITELPSLTGLPRLIDLDLSHTRIEVVPQSVIELLQRKPIRGLSVDLSGNRITDVEALLPALPRAERYREALKVNLDDNPLPVAQIGGLRNTGYDFAYTRDNWIDNRVRQREFEALRENPRDARFLDWLSDELEQARGRHDIFPNAENVKHLGANIAERFFHLDGRLELLRPRIRDLDERFAAFRKRIYLRLEDRVPLTLDELETHLDFFQEWCRTLASRQQPAFAAFINQHYQAWTDRLRYDEQWTIERISRDATQERFVQHLLKAQDEFDELGQNPEFGELFWYPYLKDMSTRWADFQTQWDPFSEALTDAFSEPVDTSTWPLVLRDNLADPSSELPSAWVSETVPIPGGQPATSWIRQRLEPVADVAWGGIVELTEDQLRRAALIFRSVKASEAKRVATQATEELVRPWWPLKP